MEARVRTLLERAEGSRSPKEFVERWSRISGYFEVRASRSVRHGSIILDKLRDRGIHTERLMGHSHEIARELFQ
jgi:hypothetical protein